MGSFKYCLQIIGGRFSPKLLSRIMFRRAFGRPLNLKNPQDINEKIQWLKFYSDTSDWSRLADKYAVREFVQEKGYDYTLVKLYEKWEDVNDICFDNLPNEFVLKTNNGTGDVIIVNDKSKVDIERVKKHLKKIYPTPKLALANGETHYLKIKPCIIAEELLDVTKQSIKSTSLIDYKIWCLNGKADVIMVIFNRTPQHIETDFYDTKWHSHPEFAVFSEHYIKAKQVLPKPACFEEMIHMAEVLSEGLPEVRVDLYEVNQHIYFGEITLTSAGGFMTYISKEKLIDMGQKVILPSIK